MRCSKYKKFLVEFADGRLDYKQAQEIQNHITVCTICRNEVEKLRSSMELVASDSVLSKEPEPPDNFPEQVLDRIHDEKTHSGFSIFALGVIVTVCLLGFSLGLYFYPTSSENEVWTYQSDGASMKTDLPKMVTSKHQMGTKSETVTKESKIKSRNSNVKTFASSARHENMQQAKIRISMEILKLLGPTLEVIEGDEPEWEVEI